MENDENKKHLDSSNKISKLLSAQERIEVLLKSENIIPERPPSLDEKGRRLEIIPAAVKGRFRTYRTGFYLFLVFVFLILPWTRFAGQQTIHLNLSERKFIFFGQTLLAHDGPFLFLIFGIIVFGLALATAWYGRVWCGWACPQTVFIDILYRKVEEWIEGNHLARRKLAQSPWTLSKIIKKGIKWTIYILLSVHIAHSFFAYFVGAKELLSITLNSPFEHWGLFLAVYIISFLTLINFSWFREQFCLVACPYGRLQAALMDERSVTVFYDPLRGEPRRQKKQSSLNLSASKNQIPTNSKNSDSNFVGDCVNCFKCVNVCPTGIDIRDGLQLECIACTACIDACDEVMDKIKKPRGLIRYASEKEIKTGEKKSHSMGLRSKIYSAIVLIFVLSLVSLLYLREDISIKVLRATDDPYQVVSVDPNNLKVINHFRLHITNQSIYDIELASLDIDPVDIELIVPNIKQTIPASKDYWLHVFVKFKSPGPLVHGKATAPWSLKYIENGGLKAKNGEFSLIGPE